MTARITFPVLFILAILVGDTADARAQEPLTRSERAEIQKLIKQLGDADFKNREEAERKLVALGEKALDAVEEARRSDDLEVRRRAEKLAPTLRRLRVERPVRELRARIESPPIDQFIDQVATRKEFGKPKNWERLYDMAEAMTQLAERELHPRAGKDQPPREWKVPKLDLKKFSTAAIPLAADRVYKQNILRVDGIKDGGQSFQDCLLVSGSALPNLGKITGSIVFVNGDIAGCQSITDSFVFCNGGIDRVSSIKNSVILATGPIGRLSSADHALFQVYRIIGDKGFNSLQSAYLTTPINFMGGAINLNGGAFIGNAKGPIGPMPFIKPFDPAKLGIVFSESEGTVRIEMVQDGKAFARAGIHAQDIVLAADKEEFKSRKETKPKDEAPAKPVRSGTRVGGDPVSVRGFTNAPFHKYLRRRLPGDEFVFKVRRGETVLECRVKLPD